MKTYRVKNRNFVAITVIRSISFKTLWHLKIDDWEELAVIMNSILKMKMMKTGSKHASGEEL